MPDEDRKAEELAPIGSGLLQMAIDAIMRRSNNVDAAVEEAVTGIAARTNDEHENGTSRTRR
jgi:hypothetical protein